MRTGTRVKTRTTVIEELTTVQIMAAARSEKSLRCQFFVNRFFMNVSMLPTTFAISTVPLTVLLAE